LKKLEQERRFINSIRKNSKSKDRLTVIDHRIVHKKSSEKRVAMSPLAE
jgi:hypothetical protein